MGTVKDRLAKAADAVARGGITKTEACRKYGIKHLPQFSRYMKDHRPELLGNAFRPEQNRSLLDFARERTERLQSELGKINERRDEILVELNQCQLVLGAEASNV